MHPTAGVAAPASGAKTPWRSVLQPASMRRPDGVMTTGGLMPEDGAQHDILFYSDSVGAYRKRMGGRWARDATTNVLACALCRGRIASVDVRESGPGMWNGALLGDAWPAVASLALLGILVCALALVSYGAQVAVRSRASRPPAVIFGCLRVAGCRGRQTPASSDEAEVERLSPAARERGPMD